jgi:hypothetical protein
MLIIQKDFTVSLNTFQIKLKKMDQTIVKIIWGIIINQESFDNADDWAFISIDK